MRKTPTSQVVLRGSVIFNSFSIDILMLLSRWFSDLGFEKFHLF